jgi:hypothetical protein
MPTERAAKEEDTGEKKDADTKEEKKEGIEKDMEKDMEKEMEKEEEEKEGEEKEMDRKVIAEIHQHKIPPPGQT